MYLTTSKEQGLVAWKMYLTTSKEQGLTSQNTTSIMNIYFI